MQVVLGQPVTPVEDIECAYMLQAKGVFSTRLHCWESQSGALLARVAAAPLAGHQACACVAGKRS